MKISFTHRVLALLLPFIIIIISTSAVVLADQMTVKQGPVAASAVLTGTSAADMGIIHLNSGADGTAVKAPVIVIAQNQESPQISDIRRTFIFGFVILILLTISLIFVFSFSR